MKIEFSDKSFIECHKDNDRVIIIIQARDHLNSLKSISNAVELTMEEFRRLISDI